MALINPDGPAFAHWTTNLGASPNAGSNSQFGTAITPGTSNADGTAVTLVSALTHDCEYLWLGIAGLALASAAQGALMDVLVDPAGGTSWSSLIDDLIVGGASTSSWTSSSGSPGIPLSYHFPIWLPAGTSIGARIKAPAGTAVTTGKVFAVAAGGNKNPASWWCGQKVETIGTFDAANSLGQLHTPGISSVFSSWADLGSPSTGRAGAVQWAVGGGGSTDHGSHSYRYEFGAAGAMIGLPVVKIFNSGEQGATILQTPMFCDIPSGTQLQVRGKTTASSIAANPGGSALDCGAYLVQ